MGALKFLATEWPTISRRLDEALSLTSAERDTWLDSLQETESVKIKLRGLLADAASAETRNFLNAPPRLTLDFFDSSDPISDAHAARTGMLIGPYRLVAELGVGGMGSVWLAERADGGLKREVALKLPRMNWSQGLAERMRRERDILASLNHPNIARIYEAGLDAQGRPYLALEYVEGEPIDVYCKRRAVDTNGRLHLILQVARAVAHAHARLVVHRDLKPANVLVTADGQVRLLDFGIAKLMEGELTQETQLTQLAGRALTLDYASPEQIRGEPIGTASDVYSLGVVAYELLAEAKPYQLQRQSAAALEAAVANVDVRLASAAAGGTTARKALTGDLDAILNKALKKNVAERYPTVDAFAQDIERYLAHLPVQAQPDAWGYRLRKLLGRNKLPVAAATAVTLSLMAGVSVALWQRQVALAQAARAVAVQAFMKQVFSATDPQQAQGQDVGALELLKRGAARLETDLKDQPDLQADLLHEIGDILAKRGENPEAKLHLEKAIALYDRLGLGETEPAINARLTLALVLGNEAQFAEAKAIVERCLQVAARRFRSLPKWVLQAKATLAFVSAQQGGAKDAVSIIEQALADHRRAGFPSGDDTVDALVDVGHAYMALEQHAKARDAYAQAVNESAALNSGNVTTSLTARLNLQYARFFLHENELVVQDMSALVVAMDRHLGATAGHTINSRCLWAQALTATGRYAEGIAVQQANVANAQARKTLDGSALAFQRGVLAILFRASARYDEGVLSAEQALAFMDGKQEAPNWQADQLRGLLGEMQRGAGQLDAAMRLLTQTQARMQMLPGYEKSKRFAALLTWLALSKHDLGRIEEARIDVTRALSIYTALGPNDLDALRCAVLAKWFEALASPADSKAALDFEDAAKAYGAMQLAAHLSQAEIRILRAELHQRAGRSSEARAEHAAGVEAWKAITGRDWKPPVAMLH